VTFDGRDVGTIDGTDFECSTTNLEAAEAALDGGELTTVKPRSDPTLTFEAHGVGSRTTSLCLR
jgi:hypothetical protein